MEKMETSKKKLELIEPFIEAGDSHKIRSTVQPAADPQVSVTEKTDIYEISRRIAEDKGLAVRCSRPSEK